MPSIHSKLPTASDFRRLAVFRTIVGAGGVTQAAAVLHKTASAVSYDLQQLEASLGEPLFHRSGRGLVLTPRGRSLAAAIEHAYLDIQSAWRDFAARDKQPLRLACVSGFGRYHLVPRLLRMMPRDRPCDVLFRTAIGVQDLLESGKVALGVSYRPLVAHGMAISALGTEELALVGPPGVPAPGPEDVSDLPFVTYEEFEYVFIRWFESNALPLPQAWHRVDHFEELEEALESVSLGRGWSIVPACAAAGREFADRVCVHRLRKKCINKIHLVGTRRNLDSPDAELIRKAARTR